MEPKNYQKAPENQIGIKTEISDFFFFFSLFVFLLVK